MRIVRLKQVIERVKTVGNQDGVVMEIWINAHHAWRERVRGTIHVSNAKQERFQTKRQTRFVTNVLLEGFNP